MAIRVVSPPPFMSVPVWSLAKKKLPKRGIRDLLGLVSISEVEALDRLEMTKAAREDAGGLPQPTLRQAEILRRNYHPEDADPSFTMRQMIAAVVGAPENTRSLWISVATPLSDVLWLSCPMLYVLALAERLVSHVESQREENRGRYVHGQDDEQAISMAREATMMLVDPRYVGNSNSSDPSYYPWVRMGRPVPRSASLFAGAMLLVSAKEARTQDAAHLRWFDNFERRGYPWPSGVYPAYGRSSGREFAAEVFRLLRNPASELFESADVNWDDVWRLPDGSGDLSWMLGSILDGKVASSEALLHTEPYE